jgi:hypothetical protein
MKNKFLFTLLTTSATLVVTHPTININLMPDTVIYTKSTYQTSGYCKLDKTFTDSKGLQVCEYKCPSTRGGNKVVHTTSINNARTCKPRVEAP